MKILIFYFILFLMFIGNAKAVEPFDTQAGMSAYVNVGSINLVNATQAYTQILNLSATHAVGLINIGNFYSSDNIHVYVDVDGWIVAYITRDEPLGEIVQWGGVDFGNPELKTTFGDAISIVSSKIGVNYSEIKGNINYYNFEYPQATNVLIFMNVGSSDYTTLFIPGKYTLYEMSYSHIHQPTCCDYYYSQLDLDGKTLSGVGGGNGRNLGDYDSLLLTKDVPHTFYLYSNLGEAGIASIIVYK